MMKRLENRMTARTIFLLSDISIEKWECLIRRRWLSRKNDSVGEGGLFGENGRFGGATGDLIKE